MSSIPPSLPGPTEIDATKSLVNSAIDFAFNPKSNEDSSQIRLFSNMIEQNMTNDYLKKDPKQIAIATISAYLKSKTKQTAGTKKHKKRHRKTRKHRSI